MNVKTWIPLVLAVALGVIALAVARKVLKPGGGGEESAAQASVVIAKRDVPPGKELAAEDLMVIKLPAGHAPTHAYGSPAELFGRTPTSPIVKGQPILDAVLAPTGAGAGVQALVPDGMRAITMEVNEFTGLAGMLVPGARVDVVTVVRDDRLNQPVARTILQNIRVAAVGRQLSAAPSPVGPENGPPPPPTNNVTLFVTLKEAQAIQLAMQGGRPWLVLRSQRDDKLVETVATSLSDLGGTQLVSAVGATTRPTDVFDVMHTEPTTRPATGPAAPAVAARTVRMVEVINGGVVTQIEVPISKVVEPAAVWQSQGAPATTVRNPAEMPADAPKAPSLDAVRPAAPPAVTETDLKEAADTTPARPTTGPTVELGAPNGSTVQVETGER